MELNTELIQLFQSDTFLQGKKYFGLFNYPYLFRLLTGNEINQWHKNSNETSKSELITIASCQSFDGDGYYEIAYSTTENCYYLKNGSYLPYSYRKHKILFKHPLKLANSLTELFGVENFNEMLITADNFEYASYCEESYNGYEESMSKVVPQGVLPSIDLRLFFKENFADGFLMDYKYCYAEPLIIYLEKYDITKEKIELLFENQFPDFNDFDEVEKFTEKINANESENIFFFIEFYPSSFKAIIRANNMSDEKIAILLKYGLIQNRIDVPDRVYELLK